jgi:protein tyrosine/serine phosphatase
MYITLMTTKVKSKVRKTSARLSDEIYKHSPIKRGVIVVKDEDKPYANYNKIMSKLYLGNIQASKDKDFFKLKKIRAVLNCSKDIPNSYQSGILQDGKIKEIEYLIIPIDDSLKEVYFEKAFELADLSAEFIHKYIDILKQPIFIHCFAGRQRSAQSIAMYLMKYHHMTPTQACKLILDNRPEAFHFGLSLNFESSIKKFYKKLHKK